MIDFQGKTWTRSGDGRLVVCEDGRQIGAAQEMTDAYIMGCVQEMAEQAANTITQAALDANDRATARADPVVKYLVTHTPADIVSYVNSNVTDLATAKTLLGKLAVAVSVIARGMLR